MINMDIIVKIFIFDFFSLLLTDVVSHKTTIYKKNNNNHVNNYPYVSSYSTKSEDRFVRLQDIVCFPYEIHVT